MKLIRPSVEIWQQNNSIDGIWAHIARCTRVCYQSTPKENGETNEEFVKRVILHSSTGEVDFNKIHGAMLEHGTVYLMAIDWDRNPLRHYIGNKYSRYNEIHLETEHCQSDTSYKYAYYVTTNLRVIYENNWLEDLQYICSPTEHHAKRVTVSFITNIGVSREFNRHRVNSIAEESTRYCNYSLGKFNNNVTYTKPSWLLDRMPANTEQYEQLALDNIIKQYGTEDEHNWEDIDYYLFSLMVSNYCYNKLIAKGWKPQQAREVLPLATKTQLIHTAFVDDWIHFLKLRYKGVSGAPHPNAKYVAEPLYKQMVAYNLIPKDI